MKKFQFIFLRLSIYLMAGILCAFYIPVKLNLGMIIGIPGAMLIFFIISLRRSRKRLFDNLWTVVFGFLLIFSLGYANAYFAKPENQPGHYLHLDLDETNSLAEITITEELKPSYTYRYLAELNRIHSTASTRKTKGKILLNIRTDSLVPSKIKPGSRILVPWAPDSISTPLNPYQSITPIICEASKFTNN